MEIGGNIYLWQMRRAVGAKRVAPLLVDAAGKNETVALDPEQCFALGQAFHCQGRGV
ncbi:hypothetical protein D3C77_648790 [compost metagenome]